MAVIEKQRRHRGNRISTRLAVISKPWRTKEIYIERPTYRENDMMWLFAVAATYADASSINDNIIEMSGMAEYSKPINAVALQLKYLRNSIKMLSSCAGRSFAHHRRENPLA